MNTELLKSKLLEAAIQGKLVPQDPNDEPVSMLLARLGVKESLRTDDISLEIPKSWCWIKMKDIADVELGKTLDSEKNKGVFYHYLCAINVKWYSFDLSAVKQLRLEEKEKERYSVKKGDLLICEGGNVGRAAIWNRDEEMYYQNALHRVRFRENINALFFLHVLKCYKDLGLIDKVSGGMTIKHFTQKSIQRLVFPLPPLAEQKRIVSTLEEGFAVIDAIAEAKVSLLTTAEMLRSKILQAAFDGTLTGADTSKWMRVKLGDACKHQNGDRGKNYPSKNKLSHLGIPFISALNLSNNTVLDDDKLLKMSEEQYNKLNNGKLHKNDFVLCIRGSVGKHGIYPFDKGAIASSLVILRPIEDRLYLLWLSYYFDSTLFKDSLLDSQNGTAQPNLAAKELMDFQIPLPPLAEQERIVAKIEELFEQIDKIK